MEWCEEHPEELNKVAAVQKKVRGRGGSGAAVVAGTAEAAGRAGCALLMRAAAVLQAGLVILVVEIWLDFCLTVHQIDLAAGG